MLRLNRRALIYVQTVKLWFVSIGLNNETFLSPQIWISMVDFFAVCVIVISVIVGRGGNSSSRPTSSSPCMTFVRSSLTPVNPCWSVTFFLWSIHPPMTMIPQGVSHYLLMHRWRLWIPFLEQRKNLEVFIWEEKVRHWGKWVTWVINSLINR